MIGGSGQGIRVIAVCQIRSITLRLRGHRREALICCLRPGAAPLAAGENATIYIKVLHFGCPDAGWEALACLPVTLPNKTGHAIPECKKF